MPSEGERNNKDYNLNKKKKRSQVVDFVMTCALTLLFCGLETLSLFNAMFTSGCRHNKMKKRRKKTAIHLKIYCNLLFWLEGKL